jgi:hypothetical protein
MATIGKTTTPNSITHGWIDASNSQNQVGMLFTMSEPGLIQSVSFFAAGFGSNHSTIYGCIWDSAGNLLASGSGVDTTGGADAGGSQNWYTDNLTSPLLLNSGDQIYVGWHHPQGQRTVWSYNGGDHSPDARARTSASSTPNTFAGHAAMSPAGAVAAYATYVPVGAYVYNGSSWVACPVYIYNGSSWVQCPVYIYNGSSWVLAN